MELRDSLFFFCNPGDIWGTGYKVGWLESVQLRATQAYKIIETDLWTALLHFGFIQIRNNGGGRPAIDRKWCMVN